MHVLCAPPAFILSQDQTLLLINSTKLRSTSSNFRKTHSIYTRIISFVFLHSSCITRLLKLMYFKLCFSLSLNSSLFAFSFFYFGSTKITTAFGFFKGFIVYFSMYFFAPFLTERFVLYYIAFHLSTHFLKLFYFLFEQIKKLVVASFFMFYLLLI